MYGTARHLRGCHPEHCSCDRIIRARGGYVNAALLALVALFIAWRAWERYLDPQRIEGLAMLAAATVGGAMNYWQHRVLHGEQDEAARYWSVLRIGLAIFVLELGVGLWSGSLALESDAWHVLFDNGAVIVSLVVVSLLPARRDREHVTHEAMSAHILGDLWQSVAVVLAGIWIVLTGQYVIDAVLSGVIAAVLFRWAVAIARESRAGAYAVHDHHH